MTIWTEKFEILRAIISGIGVYVLNLKRYPFGNGVLFVPTAFLTLFAKFLQQKSFYIPRYIYRCYFMSLKPFVFKVFKTRISLALI